MPVVDTLLRLAKEPAFYSPKWSEEILNEVRRTLARFGRTPAQIDRRIDTMKRAFPEAMVQGFSGFIPVMGNNEKDRHVLAAAVKCGAQVIVSDNQKHFPAESLAPYDLEVMTADQFFRHQYHLDPDSFIDVLKEQAMDIKWTLPQLLARHVPSLAELIKVK
jgi:hypothetical protein